MKRVPDYEAASPFRVFYEVPGHKAATDHPADQAARLRDLCALHERDAGTFVAWTADEAIRAARAANKIPSGAMNIRAVEMPKESEPPAIVNSRRPVSKPVQSALFPRASTV